MSLRMAIFFFALLVTPILGSLNPLTDESKHILIGTGLIENSGFISYDIGISKLQFDIKSQQSSYYQLSIPLFGSMIWNSSFYQSSGFQQTDSFKDEDFYVSASTKELIILGTSDSTVSQESFNTQFKMPVTNPNSNFRCNIGVGFKYDKQNYEIMNVTQSNLITQSTATYEGTALTYEVESFIPHGLIEFGYKIGNVLPFFNLSYSPFAQVNALDHHILRSKIAKFESTGNWFEINTGLNIAISNNTSFSLEYQISQLDTSGQHTQHRLKNTSEGPEGYIGGSGHITQSSFEIIKASVTIII